MVSRSTGVIEHGGTRGDAVLFFVSTFMLDPQNPYLINRSTSLYLII